nr:type I-U CRISPR-associated protein Csx17 [Streptosporangium sp. 'caverna']
MLAGYLQALGLLRVVSAQIDPRARLHWRGDIAVLDSLMSEKELSTWLVDAYMPAPIVSPWNSGSGFAGNGKSRTAEKSLADVRSLNDTRFRPLQEAIAKSEQIVVEGQQRGWGGSKGELWAKNHKIDVIRLCRALLPDEALPWLDVAVTLTLDDLAFNALAGTGGNLGRQELSATYYDRLLRLMGAKAKAADSRAWAEAALFGREDVAYLRETVGQYDPGRAGGIHSAADEKADGFANPWSFVLTMEGTLLFASAAVRRNGTGRAGEAKPFFTRSTPLGHGSAAEAESVKGEQWVPLWDQPAGAGEVAQLIGEGRAQWRHRQATSGLEFALALASLGVDRGLTGFHRFVIAERLGQNPLAIHAGKITVASRRDEGLLRGPYAWLEQVRRAKPTNAVATALRRVERELFAVAAGDGPRALSRFVIEFGRLHELVGQSGRMRSEVKPYTPRRPPDWLQALEHLDQGRDELWLAAGFASLRDDPRTAGPSIRTLLTHADGARWQDSPRSGVDLLGATLIRALAQSHRVRVIDAQDGRPGLDGEDPAARGVQTAFDYGLRLPMSLISRFLTDTSNDELVADYLRGLLALGCLSRSEAAWPQQPEALVPDWALPLLVPFFGTGQLTVQVRDRQGGEKRLHPVLLSPQPDWVSRLAARGVNAVSREAVLRLRMAGLEPRIKVVPASRADGARLAAALLLLVTKHDRERSLARICVAETARYDTSDKQGVPA